MSADVIKKPFKSSTFEIALCCSFPSSMLILIRQQWKMASEKSYIAAIACKSSSICITDSLLFMQLSCKIWLIVTSSASASAHLPTLHIATFTLSLKISETKQKNDILLRSDSPMRKNTYKSPYHSAIILFHKDLHESLYIVGKTCRDFY